VFQSCWSLSDAKIDALVRQRKTHPATRVWCWAPGWRDNEGVPDLARMTRLTGFRFKPLAKPVDQALFTVTDAKPEEILERFPDGSPSVVMRRHGAGADVFVSKPDLTAPLLHRLAALAGVHLYLPESEVGKVAIGAQARIVLDAVPDYPIPATITFVAPEAQFTPKTVETKVERQKLMFRVKAKVDPELLKKYVDYVKTGLPGVAWVRLDDKAEWPAFLVLRKDRGDKK
jgi:hypothetical protein